jgi:epoxyqueuosine reductase
MQVSDDFTSKVKEYALNEGIDLIKIAPISRFICAPKGHHPEDFLPGTQSVIMMAVKQLDGLVDYLPQSRDEYSMNFYESTWLLNMTAYKLAKFIEKGGGYKSRSMSHAWDHPGIPLYEYGTFRAHLSYQHASEACGLGRRGLSSLLMTPEFGPRVRLIGVLTTAPLVGDKMLQGKLCDPDRCGYRCVKACPVTAITSDHGLYRPRCSNVANMGGLRCGICLKMCPPAETLREWSEHMENQIIDPEKLLDWGDRV